MEENFQIEIKVYMTENNLKYNQSVFLIISLYPYMVKVLM